VTNVALFQQETESAGWAFRAVAGGRTSMGRTAGEALDTLTAQFSDQDAETLVIIRNLRPDGYFTALERQRLEQLMAQWNDARAAGTTLLAADQTELEELIDAEIQAATARAAALRDELAP
jgi:hypothetical protein